MAPPEVRDELPLSRLNGFSDAVLREQPTTLLLLTNPAQRILPRIVEEGLAIVADGTFYVHRVLGPELREIVRGLFQGGTHAG